MPSKEQKHDNDKANSKQRSPKPSIDKLDVLAQEYPPLAIMLQRAKSAPGSLTPAHVLQLQRTLGNQAVGKLLSGVRPRPMIQAKFTVGPANDHYEQEADRVTAQVRAAPVPPTLIAQRKERGNQVIQRVLGVENDVLAGDVETITKVHNKVWILRGREGDSVVIKVEAPGAKQRFVARHGYVTWLAQQVLTGVPNAEVLTEDEVDQLSQLQLPEGGGRGDPTLQKATEWGEMVFLKVETVAMGQSLEEKIKKATRPPEGGPGSWAKAVPPGLLKDRRDALTQLITNPETLKELGKTAVLDLVVNNEDRFRSNGTVNEANIDFDTLDQAIAIDNLDPNNRIKPNEWPGQERVVTKSARAGYAFAAIQDIMGKVGGIATDIPTLKPHVAAFRTGMEEAVAALKSQKEALQGKVVEADSKEKEEIGFIITSRINMLLY